MTRRFAPFLVFGVLLAAAALAFVRGERTPVPEPAPREIAEPPPAELPQPPPTTAAAPSRAPMGAENQENAALTWTPPPSWQQVPNPNPMRIATYRVGSAGATDAAAEVSVSRAGGTPEANMQRWVGQFQEATTPKRMQKKPHGVNVTIIEVSGTYGAGAMPMPGMPSTPHPGYTLVGAIAEPQSGSPYFFKLVGPSAVVSQARASFDALVDSLTPH